MVECAGLENPSVSEGNTTEQGELKPTAIFLSPPLSVATEKYPELALVIEAWPFLSDPIRKAILALSGIEKTG